MQRRHLNWVVALVGVGLAGVLAVSAATAVAPRSAASPFELVAMDRYEGACCPEVSEHVGTFTSGGPFCESGSIAAVGARSTLGGDIRSYTCADGTGSLTLDERTTLHGGDWGDWRVVEGSGHYAGLRGKGSNSLELLTENPSWGPEPFTYVYRTTMQGFADYDAVAPSLAFTSASATKLRRDPGAYSIRVAFLLRDDVEGNTVAYRLVVTDRGLPLVAEREGSTASGSISTKIRFRPSSKRVRSVQLWVHGSDPVGNEVSITRSLKLPR